MQNELKINLSMSIKMIVEALEIKNSGNAVLIPFDFGLRLLLTDDDVTPFSEICKQNPNTISQLEDTASGLIIEHEEDYLSFSLRMTEYIYVGSDSNYIAVYSSIAPEHPERTKQLVVENITLYHLVTHDSCWRVDGLEAFTKSFGNRLFKSIKPSFEASRANMKDLKLDFYGSGLERIKKLKFQEE